MKLTDGSTDWSLLVIIIYDNYSGVLIGLDLTDFIFYLSGFVR